MEVALIGDLDVESLPLCGACGQPARRVRRLGGVGLPMCDNCYQAARRAAESISEDLREAALRASASILYEELLALGLGLRSIRQYQRSIWSADAWFDAQGWSLTRATASQVVAYADTKPKTFASRNLLRAGAVGLALAPFTSLSEALAATASTNLYTRSRFTPHLNATFKMVSATATWSATLTRISDLPFAPSGDNNRFGLTFHTSTAGPSQGVFTFRRNGFTATPIFVVPSEATNRYYQAVVNRTT